MSVRKSYSERGKRSQKIFSFRMDLENYEIIERWPNKGRAINALISLLDDSEFLQDYFRPKFSDLF